MRPLYSDAGSAGRWPAFSKAHGALVTTNKVTAINTATAIKPLTTAIRKPAAFPMRKPEHPGVFLQRCYLTPLGISQSDLARILGVSRRRVNEIVNGQRAISADTALKLAAHFNTTPMFWLEKQQLWELYRALHSEPAC